MKYLALGSMLVLISYCLAPLLHGDNPYEDLNLPTRAPSTVMWNCPNNGYMYATGRIGSTPNDSINVKAK